MMRNDHRVLLSCWGDYGSLGLEIGELMGTRILFERAVPVAHLHYGAEVRRKKRGNGSCLFILCHVPAFVGEHAAGHVTVTNKNCIAQREAGHGWPEQPGVDGGSVQGRIGGERQTINQHEANALGLLHADCPCVR